MYPKNAPAVWTVVAALKVATPPVGDEDSAALSELVLPPLTPFQAAKPAGREVNVVVPKFWLNGKLCAVGFV